MWIYPKFESGYEFQLRRVLENLKWEQLYAKFSTCEFWLREIQFQGMWIVMMELRLILLKLMWLWTGSFKGWLKSEIWDLTNDFSGLKSFSITYWMPLLGNLRELIVIENYNYRLSVYSDSTKISNDLNRSYWGLIIKTNIAQLEEFDHNCIQVKSEHQKSDALAISEWKWEYIIKDYCIHTHKYTERI